MRGDSYGDAIEQQLLLGVNRQVPPELHGELIAKVSHLGQIASEVGQFHKSATALRGQLLSLLRALKKATEKLLDACGIDIDDRIYATRPGKPGNIAAESMERETSAPMRANRAKAEKTFEEVAEIAQQGQARDGLEPVEWMRLASLMYGAWNRAGQRGDPYLLPLAAMHGPGMFTTTSQVVQHLLMRHCRSDTWPESLNGWLDITRRSATSEADFMAFATALKLEMQEQSSECNAWLRSDVFEDFVEWYNSCHQAIKAQVEPLLLEYQQRAHADANSSKWLNASRYQQ
jgi:hypothetical protein